jgi:hypothetical protein
MTAWNDKSPFQKLLGSRKFLLLVLDTVISIVLWVAASYAPQAEEGVKFLIGALQPVVIMVIISIAWEDAAQLKNGG